jgi:hypothetical protein
MPKQIKSITSEDVDSDELKQRKYVGNLFFERICASKCGVKMREKNRSQ